MRRAPLALHHMAEAIEKLGLLLSNHTEDDIRGDFIRSAALERLVEIVSEASRRVEPAWKDEHPHIPWKEIAGIGNILRHDYDVVRADVLMRLKGLPLVELERAVQNLLEKYDPEGLEMKRRLFPRPPGTGGSRD
ncbi:MAG TPA: HepT-like ribonuclease domain-containing protein [Microvirga sp.]|jgi:uncharacterized protein with HEPN domain|nr:HepT-like ribonuclease domain-containing protein [Microvirga sp.]